MSPEERLTYGDMIEDLFQCSAVFNLTIIVGRATIDMYRSIKRSYLTKSGICCCRKKGSPKKQKEAEIIEVNSTERRSLCARDKEEKNASEKVSHPSKKDQRKIPFNKS